VAGRCLIGPLRSGPQQALPACAAGMPDHVPHGILNVRDGLLCSFRALVSRPVACPARSRASARIERAARHRHGQLGGWHDAPSPSACAAWRHVIFVIGRNGTGCARSQQSSV
jgi:hypothetical protein